jgi:hypothetical protein
MAGCVIKLNFESMVGDSNQSQGSVTIQLQNYGTTMPYAGDAALTETTYTQTGNAAQFTVPGNNVITPSGTWYLITVISPAGTFANKYQFVDGTNYDLTTAAHL